MATSNTTPVVIPQPIAAQATSENINSIPNGATGTNRASFQEGFPAITRMPVIENPLPTQVSGLPPKQQDFNGLFNAVSQHNFFAQNGGLYSFNQAVSDAIGGYPQGALLWAIIDDKPTAVYSLMNNNTFNFLTNPEYIDNVHWKRIDYEYQMVANIDQTLEEKSTTKYPSSKAVQLYSQTLANLEQSVSTSTTKYPSSKAVNDFVNAASNPPGTIIIWGANTAPNGYLICNGAAISRTTYARLFAAIGTTWGAGDGKTTFNVPNFNDRTVWQSGKLSAGVKMLGALPNITASWTAQGTSQDSRRPVLYNGTGAISTGTYAAGGGLACTLTNIWDGQTSQNFNASRSSSAYGRSGDIVIPTSNNIKFCIRY